MIYLDYNATTPLCDAAREAMLPYLNRHFGNPSSVHAAGREARAAVDDARDKIAALLHAVEHLENHEGFEITWLNVSKTGMVDLDQLADSIRPDTKLVSIMTANNETGVIQPMREISRICRECGVL